MKIPSPINLLKSAKKQLKGMRLLVVLAVIAVLLVGATSVTAYTTHLQKKKIQAAEKVQKKLKPATPSLKDDAVGSTDSSTSGKANDASTLNGASPSVSKDLRHTTKPSGQLGETLAGPSAIATPETPAQIYAREYKNIHQAAYYVSPTPTRSESGGYIYYTVTLHVVAFNDDTFGHPTIYLQLAHSSLNRYSCENPAWHMETFIYGAGDNSISVSCQIRACPECYYKGGPLPYYGTFSVSVGAILSNGAPTGVSGVQPYTLVPGYDRPT